MDRIEPIGPHEHDVPRIQPVAPRPVSREERERRRREQERRERERRQAEQAAVTPPEDEDGRPHVDVRV